MAPAGQRGSVDIDPSDGGREFSASSDVVPPPLPTVLTKLEVRHRRIPTTGACRELLLSQAGARSGSTGGCWCAILCGTLTQKWGNYESMGDVVATTKFVPMKVRTRAEPHASHTR